MSETTSSAFVDVGHHAHDAHVAGGVASHAAPTGWRATYGVVELRRDRAQLVAEARARLSDRGAAAPSGDPVDDGERSAGSPVGASTITGGGSSAGLEHDRPTVEAAGSSPASRSSRQKGVYRPDVVERMEFVARTTGTMSAKDQARELGVSYALVSVYRQRLAKAGRISIRHRLSDHRPWTPEDVEWFRANIGRPWPELQAHLGRSYNALIVAAKRIETDRHMRKRNRDSINANDVAAILGQEIHFLLRQAIPWGLLKAKRSDWLLSGEGAQWEIRREDLVEFLLDYPWQYDRERITDPFFRRVADEAWKRDPLVDTDEAARLLGLNGGKSFVNLFFDTLPKFMPREQLVIRRRGNPKERPGPGGVNGGKLFVHRSTLRAIATSGWVNYRTVLDDPNKLTAEKAAERLYADPERPRELTHKTLAQRVRRLMACGAIATKKIEFKGGRKPWLYATPASVMAMRDALFMTETDVFAQRLTGPRMALLRRHEPELLRRPRDLALQQASGELGQKLRTWFELEQRAIRDLHWRTSRSWALVTRHIARTLEAIGPKTKIGGRRRLRQYHLGPCAPGLVEVPLWLARKRGLEICEHCEFESKFRRKRTGSLVSVVTCVVCRTTYRRGRGRPPKLPTCPSCREKRAA